MSQEQPREERAFEGLVVDVSRRVDREDLCLDDVREPNEAELAALNLLGDDFIDRLVTGNVDLVEEDCEDADAGGAFAVAGDAGASSSYSSLYRCENVDESVEEELAKADREIIERKKRERDGETS